MEQETITEYARSLNTNLLTMNNFSEFYSKLKTFFQQETTFFEYYKPGGSLLAKKAHDGTKDYFQWKAKGENLTLEKIRLDGEELEKSIIISFDQYDLEYEIGKVYPPTKFAFDEKRSLYLQDCEFLGTQEEPSQTLITTKIYE